jgi:hypothetical protein
VYATTPGHDGSDVFARGEVESPTVIRTIWRYAWVTGMIAFLGGFVGPMIVTPDANQGPMLGLFITGPLGFIAGGLVGLGLELYLVRSAS